MANLTRGTCLGAWLELLRWHKPSGRLILLIPAGWSLWLTPNAPPAPLLVGLIVLGGLAVSAAGCIANDLWDRRIDPLVERTRSRPLADGRVGVGEAIGLLLLSLVVALAVLLVLMWGLPAASRNLCLLLAIAALPPVLLYPSAKRWFGYPQLVLAICWGFAVLIPWAAATAPIGPCAHFFFLQIKLIIILRAPHPGSGKSRANFESLAGRKTHHSFGKIRLQSIKNRFPQPHRTSPHHAHDDSA